MGRTKNCLQKKINWAIVFHYEDEKPDEVRCFRTGRDVYNALGITSDRLYYLTKKQKRHMKFKQKRTQETMKKMSFYKVKNNEELRQIICDVY